MELAGWVLPARLHCDRQREKSGQPGGKVGRQSGQVGFLVLKRLAPYLVLSGWQKMEVHRARGGQM